MTTIEFAEFKLKKAQKSLERARLKKNVSEGELQDLGEIVGHWTYICEFLRSRK